MNTRKLCHELSRVIYDLRDRRETSEFTVKDSPIKVVIFALFQEDPGLIPRLCEGLFSRVEQENDRERIYRVTIR